LSLPSQAKTAEAKKLLFKSVQTRTKIPQALTALCALGLLTADEQLVESVVAEMEELASAGVVPSLTGDVFFFKACRR
jgi:hypothetical protein